MKEYRYNNMFSISVPEKWVEIPAAALDERTNEVRAMSGGRFKDRYNAGFQQDTAKWFSPPYIMAMVIERGKLPPSEIMKFESMYDGITKEVKDATGINIQFFEKPLFDAKRNSIWMKAKMFNADYGFITSISAGFLTQKGIIFIYYFDKSSRFDESVRLFYTIADTFKLSPELVYQPDLLAGAGRSPVISSIRMVVGVSSLLVLLAVVVIRKFRKK